MVESRIQQKRGQKVTFSLWICLANSFTELNGKFIHVAMHDIVVASSANAPSKYTSAPLKVIFFVYLAHI